MVSMLFAPEDFGGAPIQALYLAKALGRKGIHVEFLTDNGVRPSVQEIYEGVTVTRAKTFCAKPLSKLREVVFTIRILGFVVRRPDLQILHFHSIRGMESFLFPFFRVIGRKVLLKLTLAESDDPLTFRKRRLLGWAYFFCLTKVHRIVAISRRLKDLSREAGLPDKIVRLIFNGVNVDIFSPVSGRDKTEIRRRLEIEVSDVLLLSIGKIEHRKGYDLLLRAYERILDSIPNAALLILGPGNNESNEYYRNLQAFISERNLPRVRFLGKRTNVDDYLKASDCFVFCSRLEGFGTVLIEAMACGIPTVAMDIPGISADIITDDRIGQISANCTAEDFSSAVIALLGRVGRDEVLKAAADIRLRFSIDRIANQYIEIYQEIVSAP